MAILALVKDARIIIKIKALSRSGQGHDHLAILEESGSEAYEYVSSPVDKRSRLHMSCGREKQTHTHTHTHTHKIFAIPPSTMPGKARIFHHNAFVGTQMHVENESPKCKTTATSNDNGSDTMALNFQMQSSRSACLSQKCLRHESDARQNFTGHHACHYHTDAD
eukprot:5628947-Amphidinium_carterae.1